MNRLGSNHKTAAAWNRALTLRLLREHGALSRQQISQMTRLRGSTLTYIVRELLTKNLVRVVGKRLSTQVGQKQVLLRLNPDAGWMLGVSLRPGEATLILLDAAGGRVDGKKLPIDGSLEALPAQLHQGLQAWLGVRGTPAGKLLALGVGVPGVVDAHSGVVLRARAFNAVNVPLHRLLAAQFSKFQSGPDPSPPGGDIAICVDHDACFGASAEAADGAAVGLNHFLYYSINYSRVDSSIRFNSYGSALFLDGQIYRGAFYAAGELTFALEPPNLDVTETELAALGDTDAELTPTLVELAERMARSLEPIMNFIDVQMIVLAGAARVVNRAFVDVVQQHVSSQLIPVPDRSVRVVCSAFEPEGAARGAAVAAFEAALISGGLLGHDERREWAGEPLVDSTELEPARGHSE